MSFVLYLTNNIGPTSVGVNTLSTIVLLTLLTNCNGGALLATQHTHFYLILCVILRGSRVALVSPNMRRDRLPWSVGGGDGLASGCKIVQNATRYGLTGGLRVPNPNSRGHATKRGFRDYPGFLNSTGRLGPKRGQNCFVTPAFSGVPNKGDKIRSQNLR